MGVWEHQNCPPCGLCGLGSPKPLEHLFSHLRNRTHSCDACPRALKVATRDIIRYIEFLLLSSKRNNQSTDILRHSESRHPDLPELVDSVVSQNLSELLDLAENAYGVNPIPVCFVFLSKSS